MHVHSSIPFVGTSSSAQDSTPETGSSSPVTTKPGSVPGASPVDVISKGPAVEIKNGELLLHGEPTYLFGGDLHYFRVRDADMNPARTWEMWADTLDKMKAAGMNHVTTYVPWDFHCPKPGAADFSGARDLRRFLEMARERDMKVILKPGPLITGEWPRGFGTFGAVPRWFLEQFPDAVEQLPNGKKFSFHVLGLDQQQPVLLHPAYLEAVDKWYEQFVNVIKPFLGNTVVGIQIDNETNHYWSDRFGGAGYSPVAVKHWQGYLRHKYGTLDHLNLAWGTKLASFEDAKPPVRAPTGILARCATTGEQCRAADWYQGGLAYVEEYLHRLRAMLEKHGIKEGEVLLTTNDSPFTLPTFSGVLLPDGRKNNVALNVLDLYPSLEQSGSVPHSQPFMVDFFTRLFDARTDLYPEASGSGQDFVYGAELQAGLYNFPGGFHPEVKPESTNLMLLRAVGRGLKGGSLYVVRDGLNADNSPYKYRAMIEADGDTTRRYELVSRWGNFLQRFGEDFLRAQEVRNKVAILVDATIGAPTGGPENMQYINARENPALFGWMQASGINADVIDSRAVTDEQLKKYKMVLHQNAQPLDDATRATLNRFVENGGTHLNLLHPEPDGPKSLGREAAWTNMTRTTTISAEVGGKPLTLDARWAVETVQPKPGAVVFARDVRGNPVGTVDQVGNGKKIHLGTNVHSMFNAPDWYKPEGIRYAEAAELGRWMAEQAGEKPIISTSEVKHLAWARRTENKLFIFVENDQPSGTDVHVNLHDGAALGIAPEGVYRIRDELNQVDMGQRVGWELLQNGCYVPTEGWGTAVLVATREDA